VDRKTVLGNPFRMYQESERDGVCDQFEIYFEDKLRNNDPVILSELRKIKALAQSKPIFKNRLLL
jgi:hypothetical protein